MLGAYVNMLYLHSRRFLLSLCGDSLQYILSFILSDINIPAVFFAVFVCYMFPYTPFVFIISVFFCFKWNHFPIDVFSFI